MSPAAGRRVTASDLGLLALRAGLAAVFVAHGYVKLFGGHDRTVALFMTVNIPAPEAMAWVVGVLELAGGLALAVGLGTRVAAGLLAADMAVAITRVRWPQGFLGAAEFEVVLLLACLALFGTGSGRISLDAGLSLRRNAR
ncbi:MAG: DoxX family protein [Candidatus Rokuibacteriota bacterium]